MIQNCSSNQFHPQNVDPILISFHFFGQQLFIAVTKIENTATVKTIFPQESPIAKGTPLIVAYTVAFGVYAKAQKIRSFYSDLFSLNKSEHLTTKSQKQDLL